MAMAKRYHDTGIWRQDWLIEMPSEYIMLWFYIKDNCCHAGIWKPNKKFIEYITGKPIELTKALELFNNGKERIRVLENGRWFLEDFIVFQYGCHLNGNNNVHASIAKILADNEIKLNSIKGLVGLNLTSSKGLV